MIRKGIIVFLFMVLISGCRASDSFYLYEIGSREKFVKEHGLPYNAPEEKQARCKAFVDYLSNKQSSVPTDELLSFVCEPDIVSLRFRKDEFVGMDLNFVLQMKEETYFEATYLGIQYDRQKGWVLAIYVEAGEMKFDAPITNTVLKDKIYSVEEKYQAEIEEVKGLPT